MRKLWISIFLIFYVGGSIFSQSPLDKKVFFTGFAGTNFSLPGGLNTFERRKQINDFVSYVNEKGGEAYGRVSPRVSPLLGFGADIRFADRFYFQPELSFSQKGFTDHLYYKWKDTLYDKTEKVKLNYLDMALAVKYQHKFYFSIYTGVVFGLNITDRVFVDYKYEIKDATPIDEHKKKFLYEVYKVDRRPYVPSYLLGIGYWYHDALEFRLRLQRTLSIFNEDSPEISFWVIQPTITYVFGKPLDKKRKLYKKGGIK